jgi:hypothetical protein
MHKTMEGAMKYVLIVAAAIALATPASAHRLSAHDYRSGPHWCAWSAAVACTKWRANGGRYGATVCPPGNMSVSCRRQRREDAQRGGRM